ncbi:hypothetical protein [Pseudochryseolinea flava]|nr:hypothetical protein [Pseudochryseolinea flava]
MKKLNKIFFAILGLVVIATSCQDDHELGDKLDKSEVNFQVIQDFDGTPGGNTVYLINNTPGTVSLWDYGTGRSTRAADTIDFAFKGDYVIKLSVLTSGGLVELDPVTITVTDDDLSKVTDPLWTLLTGGVGHEKTWVMDAYETRISKYFTSPIYFAGESNVNSVFEDDVLKWTKVCSEPGGADAICFVYEPNWKGDTWVADPADYGQMTFSLDGGATLTTDHKGIGGKNTESGTYFLNSKTLMLTTTNATPLANSWAPNDVTTMNSAKIVSLTESTMQLAFKNKTKTEYIIVNYVTKEYSDNWVPPNQPDPNFDHGDQEEILSVTPTKTWKLDLNVPYNWANLQGEMLNNWNSRADIVASGWAPYGDGDVANIDNAAISFSSDGKVVVTQDNGATQSGTYTVDEETNMITFSGITPSINIASWVNATTGDGNKWKIVKVERDELTDAVEGIWFGKRDPEKAEYMVFHFVLR